VTIIMPMAGKGERFFKKGFTIPKPLIPVEGVPMVIKAVLDLPAAQNYIFIALESHVNNFPIAEEIRKYLANAEFVVLDQVTEGQACTCLLGLGSVSPEEEILIAACDNGMIYNREIFEKLKNDSDVIVFSFRNNVTVKEKPEQYGWIKASGYKVESLSVKKPLSKEPEKDHAVTGAFWFKKSSIFKSAAEKMIKEDRRINNEFYVDECINDAVDLGYRVSVMEIEKYICWGTPDDYATYHYWRSFYQ